MEINKPHCIICSDENMVLHFYPPNKFNHATYNYYRCRDCNSLSVYPFPDEMSLKEMYNKNFHPYVESFNRDEISRIEHYRKYTAQRYQLDFLVELKKLTDGKKLLDFGCGGGIYLACAEKLGFDAIGIEYDTDFVSYAREKTKLNIFSLPEFETRFKNQSFDIIHFGHNLEHLPNPYEIFNNLKKYAHPDTLFVIDGPLENNPCFSRFIINLFSKIRKREYNTFPPYHLTFTNYNSQLLFFKNLNLTTVKYVVKEQYWPFPEKITWSRPSSIIGYSLARISIFISSFVKRQGNLFHFVGKFTER